MLKDEQKSAKTLPQRLAGLNKGCGAWGENLACGVARQGVFLGRSGAWQSVVNSATHNTAWRGEFDNETAQRGKIQQHGNKIQRNKFSVASVCGQNSARLHDKFGLASVAKWAVLAGEVGKAKMEQCLGGGRLCLSLSRCSHFVARLWVKFKGFFYSFCRNFISFYFRFCSFHRNFVLSCRKFFLFHRGFSSSFRSFFSSFCSCFSFYHSFNSSFCLQKAFFRALCFFEIFNALFLGFLCLSLLAVFVKTAWQSINLALFLLFGLPRSFCSLAMTARLTALAL